MFPFRKQGLELFHLALELCRNLLGKGDLHALEGLAHSRLNRCLSVGRLLLDLLPDAFNGSLLARQPHLHLVQFTSRAGNLLMDSAKPLLQFGVLLLHLLQT